MKAEWVVSRASLRSVSDCERGFPGTPLEETADLWDNRRGQGLSGISQGVLEMKRKPTAFTLVELLVVITIIGMLVALLIPAVISARETARRGVCVSRLKELATATIHYESIKGQLPGWRNQAPLRDSSGNITQISWIVVLFPYLDREDLWVEWRDGDGDTTGTVSYEQVCCPSDMGNLINTTPLNYVANRQLFLDRSTTTLAASNTRMLERLKSAQQTVMFSERVYRTSTPATPVGPWTGTADADLDLLTFVWDVPATSIPVYSLYTRANGISSNHSGTVNIAFADGHVETVAQDTMTNLFLPE